MLHFSLELASFVTPLPSNVLLHFKCRLAYPCNDASQQLSKTHQSLPMKLHPASMITTLINDHEIHDDSNQRKLSIIPLSCLSKLISNYLSTEFSQLFFHQHFTASLWVLLSHLFPNKDQANRGKWVVYVHQGNNHPEFQVEWRHPSLCEMNYLRLPHNDTTTGHPSNIMGHSKMQP